RKPVSSYVAGFIGETNLIKGTMGEGGVVETSTAKLSGKVSVENWSPEVGAALVLSMRPEALEIVSPEGANLKGKIVERIYLGSIIQYSVRLGDGQVVQVTEQNPQLIREPGDQEIGLAISQNDITLLAR
ncbi:TOBE domain-containing protein, partial [Akkermansiaceae bacterium]|nr:TOBE domain-containing protein [Akkermansiaceae bacterium]